MGIVKTPKGTELKLRDLRGQDYLEVKYRIVWFNEERPNWSIETSYLVLTDKTATAKAIIRDENDRLRATAHKREDITDFKDFTEKAETGAMGRALATIGFGTQFAVELDEGERIVDAGVDRKPKVTLPLKKDNSITSISQPTNPEDFKIGFGEWNGKPLKEITTQKLQVKLAYIKNLQGKKDFHHAFLEAGAKVIEARQETDFEPLDMEKIFN